MRHCHILDGFDECAVIEKIEDAYITLSIRDDDSNRRIVIIAHVSLVEKMIN